MCLCVTIKCFIVSLNGEMQRGIATRETVRFKVYCKALSWLGPVERIGEERSTKFQIIRVEETCTRRLDGVKKACSTRSLYFIITL